MPHLTVHAAETTLTGHEAQLITALTDAVTTVYGEWARPIAQIRLIGIPTGRWGTGGEADPDPAPSITFGVKAAAFEQPDVLARLAAGVTTAVTDVLGPRNGITVEFVGTHPGRTATDGVIDLN